MGENSKIQWTDVTWNVARGCSKVDEDCKFCYMYRDSFDGTRYNPMSVTKTKTVFELPLKLKEPSKIFTSSLTDVFHKDIDSYRNEIWDIIRKCPQHIFQILTKRPERIIECLPDDFHENFNHVWLGTSVGHTSEKSLKRIYDLINIRKRFGVPNILFLSLEPLWGEVKVLNRILNVGEEGFLLPKIKLTQMQKDYSALNLYNPDQTIDWVIVGGESGHEKGKYQYRPCDIKWIENIIEDCKEAGVPVFVKQLGTYLAKKMNLKDRAGGEIGEWPEHLRIRLFPNY